MSDAELKDRLVAATETANALRERLKQKRLSLLDTDGISDLGFFFNIHYYFCYYFLFWGSDFVFRCVSDLPGFGGECRSRGLRDVAESGPAQLRTHRSGLL